MTTEPSPSHAGRMKFKPFARRRARKAAAAAAQVEQRAWWHQRWSDAIGDFRERTRDRVPVRRRRLEAELEAGGVGYVRLPGSKLHVRVGHMEPEGPVVDHGAWVHRTGETTRMAGGRWGSAPYRNPDRAAKLAKSGRLRRDA